MSIIAFLIHLHLASTLNLGNDEAHYFVWSLKPSLGYLDDAPFVAYCIYFFTHIFGVSQLSVRLGAIIFAFFDGIAIYYLTYLLFKNKKASLFAYLFFIFSPLFGMALSVMMLPDAPLLFFYTIFLICLFIAIDKKDNILWWIFAGVFLGLSFLSKYTAALIPPAVLLYFLISGKNRGLLKTAYPYICLITAIVLFSPVIYWNAIHNFISFKFQLSHGFSSPKPGLVLFIQGWISQFIAITPFIYIFIVYSFIYFTFYLFIFKIKYLKSSEKESILFSLCMSAPILIFFIANGYSHRILFHWPDLGYISAFPLVGYLTVVIIDKTKVNNKIFKLFRFYVYFALFIGLLSSIALYYQIYYNAIPVGKIIRFIDKEQRLHKRGTYSLIPHIPGKPKTADITNDLFGWKKSAHYINIIYRGYKIHYPSLFILTHHYAISDELIFYAKFKAAKNIYNISGFLNQYYLWQNLNKINGKDALFIMDNKYMINPITTYKRFFKSIKKIGDIDIYVKSHPVRIFYIYLMQNFKSKQAINHISYRLY